MPPSLTPRDVTDVGAVASELLGQNTLGQCRGAYLDNFYRSQFRLRLFFPEQSGRIATADHLQVAIRPLVPVLRL
jgi:hypothetical protein